MRFFSPSWGSIAVRRTSISGRLVARSYQPQPRDQLLKSSLAPHLNSPQPSASVQCNFQSAQHASSGGLLPKPNTSPTIDSPLLNKLIKQCATWQDMQVLLRRYGAQQFNFVHAAAAVTQLAQLKSREEAAAAAARGRALYLAAGVRSEPLPEMWPRYGAPLPSAYSSSSSECFLADCVAAEGAMLIHASAEASPSPRRRPGAVAPQPAAPQATLPPSYDELLDSLASLVRSRMHQFGARQASNALWSLAHLQRGTRGGGTESLAASSPCLSLAAEMIPLMRALLPWCEPQVWMWLLGGDRFDCFFGGRRHTQRQPAGR